MSYLLDKKKEKKRFLYICFFVFIFCILFYFRLGIWNGLSYVTHVALRPVLVLGNNVGGKLGSLSSYFISKNSLYLENQSLKSQISESQADQANYDSVVADNDSLKEILGRKDTKATMVLSAILGKPNQSPYDTLIIDAGQAERLQTGDMVFAMGNVPIGRLAEVYPNSSKIILFSNSGEKTQVVVSQKPVSTGPTDSQTKSTRSIFMEAVGRGGGNFEMIIPRDFSLAKGDTVVLPGITPYVLGIVEKTISDPRDPFIKALLVSPVNIQELKFVQVEVSAK